MRVKRIKLTAAKPDQSDEGPSRHEDAGLAGILTELTSVATSYKDRSKSFVSRKSLNPHRSRFIFTLSGPSDEELRREELTAPPELPRSSRQVDDRAEAYSVELPSKMEDIMVKTREFMLTELAPKAMASMTGIDQARSVVERVVGGKVDGVTEHFFHQLLIKATNLRLCKFVAELFDLPVEEVQAMLAQVDFTKKLVIERPPIGNPLPELESNDERRPEKKSKPILPRASGDKSAGGRRRTRSRAGRTGSRSEDDDV